MVGYGRVGVAGMSVSVSSPVRPVPLCGSVPPMHGSGWQAQPRQTIRALPSALTGLTRDIFTKKKASVRQIVWRAS